MGILRRVPVIWATGLCFVALTIAFAVWIRAYDLTILDRLAKSDDVRAVLASMSERQRSAHWWMTLSLDFVYPLAYGGFFAGLALRAFGRVGPALAVPAFICIVADIAENLIQLHLLQGGEAFLGTKAILTPIKFTSFYLAATLALVGLVTLALRRFAHRAG